MLKIAQTWDNLRSMFDYIEKHFHANFYIKTLSRGSGDHFWAIDVDLIFHSERVRLTGLKNGLPEFGTSRYR